MIINGINLTNINVIDIDSFAANLVLYYNPGNTVSYPGTGTTVYDLSGNNLNGAMSNITYTNPYFSYNGSNSQVSIASNSLLQPLNGDWTMEVWFNTSQFPVSNSVILGKFETGGLPEDVSYSIRMNSLGRVFAQLGNGDTIINSTVYQAVLNTWVQIVYVWNNVSQNNLITYVNGVSVGTEPHTINSILNASTNLYLGSYNNGEFSQYYNGRIGITRLYSVALLPIQVLQNFEANKKIYNL